LINILPIAILILNWKFHEKRTKKHHNITLGIILFWIIISFISTYFVLSDYDQIKELLDGKDTLIKQNKKLTGKIEIYQKDLNEKDRKIKELEKNAKKLKRGITLAYDFKGTKRTTTRPGHISLNFGIEVKIFKKINELEKQKNYPELRNICEQQITKTPEWLTPYLYLGLAYANMNNKEKAIEMFEYVLRNAPDDPAYSQANDFLEKLKNQ